MKSIYIFILSELILFPLLVGLVRLRRIKKSSYQPFFFLILMGAFWELLNVYFIKVLHLHNVVVVNFYMLFEWLLIAWQFRMWGLLRSRNAVFYAVLLLPCLVWLIERLVFWQMDYFVPYYQVLYCFLVVLFSVNTINFMITHDYRNLFGNPTFLICIGFIIYFIYTIIFNWAYQTSLMGATETTTFIIMLHGYVNALTNVIFAIALLRIPQPQKFTLN
ncbi:hypothetical protein [Puia sp.]|jgi:hypothetical protein|uniref:hypothetical protein n=1 Tax=Puia sp. TaxID=2045100 RepID=UPI002F40F683